MFGRRTKAKFGNIITSLNYDKHRFVSTASHFNPQLIKSRSPFSKLEIGGAADGEDFSSSNRILSEQGR
jgi:hypothetical protein